MGNIKAAFDNLLDTIEKETLQRFEEMEAKLKAKRLALLEKDLEELRAKKPTE